MVKNMTDSDLLDMHYFLTEDDDLDEDEFEEGLNTLTYKQTGYNNLICQGYFLNKSECVPVLSSMFLNLS